MSRSGWARDGSTYATVVVQPLAGGGSGFYWASTKMSLADGSWVSIRVIKVICCTQGASLASSISHEGMVRRARARSRAIFATTRCNEQCGAWMYSRSQRWLLQPRFHPLSSLVQSLGHFLSAALTNTLPSGVLNPSSLSAMWKAPSVFLGGLDPG